MKNYKDTDIREALKRKYADTPQLPADFTDRLMQRMDQQNEQPKHRRLWLYSAVGAVAASIVLLFSVGTILSNQHDEKTGLVAQADTVMTLPQTETPKVEENPLEKEDYQEMVDSVKIIKEKYRMPRAPKHYMAKAETEETMPEPELIDEIELMERAIAEEESRMIMEMMSHTNGSLQADFKGITDEIRQRGERMTQQVELALNEDE